MIKGLHVFLIIADAIRQGLLNKTDFIYFAELLKKEHDLNKVFDILKGNTTIKNLNTYLKIVEEIKEGVLDKNDFIYFGGLLAKENNLLKVFLNMHNYLMGKSEKQWKGNNAKKR